MKLPQTSSPVNDTKRAYIISAPEVFHALTTALRREPRLRFTLTEVNDLPVRQTPMFTLLREAGFSSSPQGLDWG